MVLPFHLFFLYHTSYLLRTCGSEISSQLCGCLRIINPCSLFMVCFLCLSVFTHCTHVIWNHTQSNMLQTLLNGSLLPKICRCRWFFSKGGCWQLRKLTSHFPETQLRFHVSAVKNPAKAVTDFSQFYLKAGLSAGNAGSASTTGSALSEGHAKDEIISFVFVFFCKIFRLNFILLSNAKR